ncbi:translocator protein homolog [Oryza brachyantha]|uniref:translocator protein homolog n=1 Tax=Oryza brachyantha TaxID=4533 RepID=UPI001ADB5E0D|nr:translocator protein homolog [Oryza brachyantha]
MAPEVTEKIVLLLVFIRPRNGAAPSAHVPPFPPPRLPTCPATSSSRAHFNPSSLPPLLHQIAGREEPTGHAREGKILISCSIECLIAIGRVKTRAMATAAAQEGITHRGAVRGDADAAAPVPASRDTRKAGRAKRGLRSLAAAVSLSVALTAASFYGSGSSSLPSASAAKVTVARAGSVAAEAVMALAAWMVWAEGGLHRRPGATLAPFLAQLGAALAWAPVALGLAAPAAGLACCAAMAAAAAACARGFGAVNPVAGDLAKPCVAWAILLAVMNYKMMK